MLKVSKKESKIKSRTIQLTSNLFWFCIIIIITYIREVMKDINDIIRLMNNVIYHHVLYYVYHNINISYYIVFTIDVPGKC